MVIYSFRDKTLKGIFEEWTVCKQKAYEYLDLVTARTEIIEFAVTNKTEPDKIQSIFLYDEFFKDVRKMMNLFTHVFRRTIKEKEEDPSFSPITEENFKRMKEIYTEANNWYKQFNKAAKKYRDIELQYYTSFLDIPEAVDFTCEEMDFRNIVRRLHL